MKHKFPYLLNEKININGRQIYCKVTGKPNSANDGQPYVLVITGGPGFGHELTESYMKPILPIAAQEKTNLPHFIFFDNLGCGQSDKAQDPNKEYTVDNFTDLSTDLVKAIKDKLNLAHMNLYVEGGSFGSLVAMNFPARKPEWLDPQADIHLNQVTAKVVANGSGMADYAFNFLKENYNQHPNYEKIVQAQKKLYSGTIKDQADYVKNFVLPMASLYVKDVNKAIFYKVLQQIINRFPNATIRGLNLTNRLLKKLGIEIEALNFADSMLGQCSLDVLNHFFRNDFNGFNLFKTIEQNKHIYQQIPICMISASEDHVCDYKLTEAINQQLPSSSAAIIFKEPHMLSKGPSKSIYDKLNYDLLVSGHIPAKDVNYPVIINNTVSAEFNQLLANAHNQQPAQAFTPSSTVLFLTAMPPEETQQATVAAGEENKTDVVAAQDHHTQPAVNENSALSTFVYRPSM